MAKNWYIEFYVILFYSSWKSAILLPYILQHLLNEWIKNRGEENETKNKLEKKCLDVSVQRKQYWNVEQLKMQDNFSSNKKSTAKIDYLMI